MIISRDGAKDIIKKEIQINSIQELSISRLKEARKKLKQVIEVNSLNTFDMITLIRKNYSSNLVNTIYNKNLDYTKIKCNCFYQSRLLKKELSKIGIDTHFITFQANNFALKTGDDKIKEAHMALLAIAFYKGKQVYIIFDPGLRLDIPIAFSENQTSQLYETAGTKIKIYYDKRDEKYPYYIALNGQNIYSYDRKYQNYIQKFNPRYETINLYDVLFPISYEILTGYKATTYSRDIKKRAYIILSPLRENLEIYDCKANYHKSFNYDEILKLGYKGLFDILVPVCNKLNINTIDMIDNIFFMIENHNEFVIEIMNKKLVEEYKEKKHLSKVIR